MGALVQQDWHGFPELLGIAGCSVLGGSSSCLFVIALLGDGELPSLLLLQDRLDLVAVLLLGRNSGHGGVTGHELGQIRGVPPHAVGVIGIIAPDPRGHRYLA